MVLGILFYRKSISVCITINIKHTCTLQLRIKGLHFWGNYLQNLNVVKVDSQFAGLLKTVGGPKTYIDGGFVGRCNPRLSFFY